ncbi:hypothetical protein L7F22_036438 [Adiantum nelumboides]|nr:hypothetical protein [Adiantum nelumboides]
MGIPGLLKVLKPYTHSVHVRKYSGQRVGIDAYCWLHKGAYACSFGVCDGSQKISSMQPCVKYCMHYINLLRFNNIIPVVVFDGGRLPSKALTENERHRYSKNKSIKFQTHAASNLIEGFACLLIASRKTLTSKMISTQVLKAEGVEFVVAPYEADAQLAYLSSLSPEKGGVAAVISEDSDLLAYGCDVVMYKMDRYGNGEEVRLEDIMTRKTTSEGPSNSLWFGCFTPDLFTGMCVLAGCDFLPSVSGIGIKRAHCLVCKYRDLARVLSSMRFDRKLVVPGGYELAFKQANAIFHHARIYDGSARKLSFLKALPVSFLNEFNGDLDFLGPDLPPSRASAIAEGRLDPISMCAFDEPTLSELQILTPIFSGNEPKRDRDSSDGHTNFHKEDVWLGTDEELFTMLAATASAVPLDYSTSTNTASLPCDDVRQDSGFVAHLVSMSSSRVVPQTSCEEQGPTVCSNSFVTLSPGKKRVLPPKPNNNPFKRARNLDEPSDSSNKVARLFNSEIDEQLFSKKQTNRKQLNSTVRVQHHEQAQSTHSFAMPEKSFLKLEDAEIYCKAALVPPYGAGSAREGTKMAVERETLLYSLCVEPAAKVDKVHSVACMVEVDTRACKAEALDPGSRAARLQVSEVNNCKDPEFWGLPCHILDQNLASQQRCDVSIAPDKSPTLCSEHIQISNPVAHCSKIAVTSKKQRRETNKIKNETRSSKQGAKVTVSPSTPGLLKFFQRKPGL